MFPSQSTGWFCSLLHALPPVPSNSLFHLLYYELVRLPPGHHSVSSSFRILRGTPPRRVGWISQVPTLQLFYPPRSQTPARRNRARLSLRAVRHGFQRNEAPDLVPRWIFRGLNPSAFAAADKTPFLWLDMARCLAMSIVPFRTGG